MSVLIQTTLGDFVIDLYFEKCPLACENFINLCKIKYYHNCVFYSIQTDFIAQTGDPTGSGRGGQSMDSIMSNNPKLYFKDEFTPTLRHNRSGRISMFNFGKNTNNSQFYITLTDRNLDYLDDKYTIFGQIEEGMPIIDALNQTWTNDKGTPYQDIRIVRTIILLDPYVKSTDKIARWIPSRSPSPIRDRHKLGVGETDKDIHVDEKDTKSKAVLLEISEDIPDADITPPDSTLFVCKLNTVTKEDDLRIIFSRFGEIKSLNLVRDPATGKSMCYGFIDFATRESCELAYLKMENVVIDDRRIHVDFSQSVSKLWNRSNKSSRSKGKRKDEHDQGGQGKRFKQ